MWCYRWLFFFILCGALFAAPSCGYHLSSTSPIVLPQNIQDLFLEEVRDPTTESWLSPMLRSRVRREFSRRGSVEWVSQKRAEGLLRLHIMAFSSSSKLQSAQEETVRSEVILRLQARIFDSSDQSLIWESEEITARKSYSGSEVSRAAEEQAVRLAAEKLADQLARGF